MSKYVTEMGEYDYGNARLRAMKSRLLTRGEMEALAETGNLAGLIAGLTKTAYRRSVESALARTSGMDCLIESLHQDLIECLGKMRDFYSGRAGEYVAIALRAYDIHNLIIILRGLAKHASAGEMLAGLLPVGELRRSLLVDLTRAPGPRAAIDQLGTLGSVFAVPLMRLRSEHPGAEIVEMELALERWHHREARERLKEDGWDGKLLSQALDLEADVANLVTALRFASNPGEREFLDKHVGNDHIEALFVGPGSISIKSLVNSAQENNLESALKVFVGTRYAASLQNGLQGFSRTGRLSAFELHLKRLQLEWTSGLIAKDPLGIGVVLGYLGLKTNEVSNLRWIGQGIGLGLTPAAIRAELEFAG